jgi:hypothetical protein
VPESSTNEVEVARLLAKTARVHAPKLAWRSDDEVSELIKTEVARDAAWIASALPPDAVTRVVEKFLDVLWDEIDRCRRNRITKI